MAALQLHWIALVTAVGIYSIAAGYQIKKSADLVDKYGVTAEPIRQLEASTMMKNKG